jgi:uncharacterized metal-binding protein
MDYTNLYNTFDKQILKWAEDSKNRKNNRMEEIIAFAKTANIRKIGIANCTSFVKERNGNVKEILDK